MKRDLSKKITFKKTTVANLNPVFMKHVLGGGEKLSPNATINNTISSFDTNTQHGACETMCCPTNPRKCQAPSVIPVD